MLSKDNPKPKPACEAPERLRSDWKPVLLGQLTTDTDNFLDTDNFINPQP
jgi:hypothetical protein